MTNDDVIEDLDEDAAERAEQVRRKRIDRADPAGRVERIREQKRPAGDLDLPDPSTITERADESFATDGLPPELREEVEDIRKKVTYGLSAEFGVEIDSEAHFWPLIVHLGVERLRTMWLEEVVDTYEAIDELEPPEED